MPRRAELPEIFQRTGRRIPRRRCGQPARGPLLANPKSYPVGMVNLLDLYPLGFGEFLEACDETLYRYYADIRKRTARRGHISFAAARRLQQLPDHRRNARMRRVMDGAQRPGENRADTARAYRNLRKRLSKHNGKVNSGRILMVFRSIASQLAKQNEKFVYGAVREGARAREFEEAIEWLVSAGMINRVYNVSKPEHPLPAFDKLDCSSCFIRHRAPEADGRGRQRRDTSEIGLSV